MLQRKVKFGGGVESAGAQVVRSCHTRSSLEKWYLSRYLQGEMEWAMWISEWRQCRQKEKQMSMPVEGACLEYLSQSDSQQFRCDSVRFYMFLLCRWRKGFRPRIDLLWLRLWKDHLMYGADFRRDKAELGEQRGDLNNNPGKGSSRGWLGPECY